MRQEARAELISAYLDNELRGEEAERFQKLLAEDESVRREVEGMRSVVSNLRHLERMAPPPTLDHHVARRIALAGEHRSLLDRIEGGLSGIQSPSNNFLMFALVFALAIIVYMFSVYLDKDSMLPVVFKAENRTPIVENIEHATSVLMGSRMFLRQEDGRWVEDGLSPEEVASAQLVQADSPMGRELLEHHPDLKGLTLLGDAIFRLRQDDIIELKASLVHGPVHGGL